MIIINVIFYTIVFLILLAIIKIIAFSDTNIQQNVKTSSKPQNRETIKPVISKDPVIDETPIGKGEDPRYKDFINAQWDEMNK